MIDICENYHGGNEYSVAAHQTNAKTTRARDRERIKALLLRGPHTCDSAELALGLSHQTCSARFSELKRDGEIVKSGVGTTRSGSKAALFSLPHQPVYDPQDDQGINGPEVA